MPGHRWDPEKKRFFKIVPGQAQSESTPNIGGSIESFKRSSKNKEKIWKERIQEQWFAKLPPFPVVRLGSTAFSNPRTSFALSNTDPTILKQKGRTPLFASDKREQDLQRAMYSRLALFRAVLPVGQMRPNILAFQTDLDNQCLLVLTHISILARISPLSETPTAFRKVSEAPQPKSGLFLRTLQALFHTPELIRGRHAGISVILPQREDDPSRLPYLDAWQPFPCEHRQLGLPNGPLDHDLASWAVHETLKSPAAPGRGPQAKAGIFLALSNCRSLFVSFVDVRGDRLPRFLEVHHFKDSDCMSISFDRSGEILYCGTRSGAVLAVHWRKRTIDTTAGGRDSCLVPRGGGSVTHLNIVSDHELLVVRIHGQVELVDTRNGQVQRRFEGHVNSYEFRLGCAVDSELRLLALAGLDRRVRVWSLDSSAPLGTSEPCLPHIYHVPTRSPEQVHQYDDRLGSRDWQTFQEDHQQRQDRPSSRMVGGSTLASIVFPADIRALHWHPRSVYECRDADEAHALAQEPNSSSYPFQQQWKDLYVGAGPWVYHFRWP